jgi:transketolase
MHSFGASAPEGELFRQFGITAEAAADKVRQLLADTKPKAPTTGA